MASIIVLMGPQGAGKGTQAQMVAERYGLPIVATGDMLRDVARTETSLGGQVRKILASGQLVSDDVLAEVVRNRTSQEDCRGGYILDGFPRTLPQALLLEDIAREQGHRIIVIKISILRELLSKRLTGRLQCPVCGSLYNTYFMPPKREGVCDLDGQPLVKRSDDNEEAIAQRLALYDEKTKPLVDYYNETGRVYRVDGTGTPEEVFSRVAGIVQKEATGEGGWKTMSED
jgi:adenylate kinase